MKYRLFSAVKNEFVSDNKWELWGDAYCEKWEKYTPEEIAELDIYVEEVPDETGT